MLRQPEYWYGAVPLENVAISSIKPRFFILASFIDVAVDCGFIKDPKIQDPFRRSPDCQLRASFSEGEQDGYNLACLARKLYYSGDYW